MHMAEGAGAMWQVNGDATAGGEPHIAEIASPHIVHVHCVRETKCSCMMLCSKWSRAGLGAIAKAACGKPNRDVQAAHATRWPRGWNRE